LPLSNEVWNKWAIKLSLSLSWYDMTGSLWCLMLASVSRLWIDIGVYSYRHNCDSFWTVCVFSTVCWTHHVSAGDVLAVSSLFQSLTVGLTPEALGKKKRKLKGPLCWNRNISKSCISQSVWLKVILLDIFLKYAYTSVC